MAFPIAPPSSARRWAVVALLVALAAAVYGPVRHYGFIRFDDPENVADEPHVAAGLTAGGLRWAATSCLMGHWVPLTRVTYLLDRRWWRLDPGVMHVEDVALHAATAAVLFGFLAEATGAAGRSAAVALVFVVHPMHVESVAWLTERRDVLSTPLLLGSFWAYVRYARAGRPGRWAAYAAALVLYAASLSAKAMGMTAPALLLLLDGWPLGRLPVWGDGRGWRRVVLEKVPFAALAVPVAAMAMHAQRSVGAAASLAAVPPSARVANGLVTTVLYVGKLAWPARLSAMYLTPPGGWAPGQVVAAAGLVGAAAVVAVRARRRRPSVAFGLGWFAVALLPVSGAAQSGWQSMADRYTYLPSVGLGVAAVWAVADAARAAVRDPVVAGRVSAGAMAAVVAGLAVAGRVQVGYWRDERALFAHAADVTDDNWFAYDHLGLAAAADHDYRAAAVWFERTLALNPAYADAYDDLGNCVYQTDPAGAIPVYRQAIAHRPADPRAYANLGNALLATGHPAEAVAAYDRSLAVDPASAYARAQRAAAVRRRDAAPNP